MAVSTQSVSIGTAAGGDVTLAPAVADKRVIVTGFTIVNSVATAQGIQFKSGTTALTGVMGLPSSIGGALSPSSSAPAALFATAKGAALVLTITAATAIAGWCSFRYE